MIDSANGEGEDGSDNTSDWIKLASRGGLLHVKDSTYRVFHSMELVVRQFFRREGIEMLPTNPKHHIIESVKQDEDVGFYWCLAASDMDNDHATTLLEGIIDLWVPSH